MPAETIAVIAFDKISPFHLSVPCAVFGEDRRDAGVPKFEVLVCGMEKGTVATSAGFSLTGLHSLRETEHAGSQASLRLHFNKALATTPARYRKEFRG